MRRIHGTGRIFVARGFRVDDFVQVGSGKELEALANGVDAKHGITDQGGHKCLVCMLMERDRSSRTISISHGAFIDSILTRFNLTDAVPVTTPFAPGTHLSTDDSPTSKDEMEMRSHGEVSGALVWFAFGTRSDIAFPASSLARFGHNLANRCLREH